MAEDLSPSGARAKHFHAKLLQAQAENERLRYALTSIMTPEGAYSRDPAEYRKNVIDWCIETAKAALAEGDTDEQM